MKDANLEPSMSHQNEILHCKYYYYLDRLAPIKAFISFVFYNDIV